MQFRSLRVLVPAVVVAVLVGATAAVAAHRTGAAAKTYAVTAALKGKGGSGAFTGTLTVAGSKGGLKWQLKLRGDTASALHIRLRANQKLLLSLCTKCKASGSHVVLGKALTALVKNQANIVVQTKKHGEWQGPAKVKAAAAPAAGGGAGLTITPTPALIAQGKKWVEHYSCQGCHTIDGTKSTGPTWKGLAGRKEKTTEGTTVVATDQFLFDAITDPTTLHIVGYDSGIMAEMIPPGTVSDAQAKAIVAYIKSLK